MDEQSARETSPSLRNFRHGWVDGHCRVFNLVSIVNVRRGLAVGRRLATATARPRDGSALRVCLYEIPLRELPALARREARLLLTVAQFSSDNGRAGLALLCAESSHERYVRDGCGGDMAVYQREVGQYYDGSLYRSDLLPVPTYVMRCLRAQRQAGASALSNFLDASFLGDGETTLRTYLEVELQSLAKSKASEEAGVGPRPADSTVSGPRDECKESATSEASAWPTDELAELLSEGMCEGRP
jgi:hypothetical protein